MNVSTLFFHILSYAGAALYLGGATLLFVRSRQEKADSRARRALAFNLLMWGIAYLPACIDPQAVPAAGFHPMSVVTLVAGNLYVIFCLLYPLELARPGWINARRLGLLLLPYASIVAVYFGVLLVLGEPVRALSNVPELLARLGEFNVWFRFVLYLSVCFYLAYLFVFTSTRLLEYHRKTIGLDRSADRETVQWLRIYGISTSLMTVAYLGVLLYGNQTSLMIHRCIAIAFFAVVIAKAGFRRRMQVLPETAEQV